MTISEIQLDGKITLAASGSIDTVSTPEFQQAVIAAFQRSNDVTIDLNEVTYVSSAGLRAFLLGQKTADSKGATMTIVNANESVMGVFNMSGFSKLLNIK